MTWIDVDAEKLRSAAEALRGISGEAQALADYAQEADPDWWMWGLGGAPFAALYFPVAEGIIHPAFAQVVDSLEGMATSLEQCADDHEGNDTEIARALDKIGQEIEGRVS